MQKCPKHRNNGHGQGVSTGCGSTLCPFYSSGSQIGWVTFSLGRWGAVLARNPTQDPLEHTLGMGLGAVFARACFSWGKLFAKRQGSSSGNAEYISQTPVLFTDSRRSQRTEQVSWGQLLGTLGSAVSSGHVGCCKDGCRTSLHFKIVVVWSFTSLLLPDMPVWGGESAEKPAVHKNSLVFHDKWCDALCKSVRHTSLTQ